MINAIFSKVLGFLGNQWGVIASIGAGLIVLTRYIEDNAIKRAERRELQDALARIKQNKRFKEEYAQEINNLERVDIVSIMRSHNEFRDPQSE